MCGNRSNNTFFHSRHCRLVTASQTNSTATHGRGSSSWYSPRSHHTENTPSSVLYQLLHSNGSLLNNIITHTVPQPRKGSLFNGVITRSQCRNPAVAVSFSYVTVWISVWVMMVQLSNTTNLSDIHSDFASMLDTLSNNSQTKTT
jgi:hypothetical protein